MFSSVWKTPETMENRVAFTKSVVDIISILFTVALCISWQELRLSILALKVGKKIVKYTKVSSKG